MHRLAYQNTIDLLQECPIAAPFAEANVPRKNRVKRTLHELLAQTRLRTATPPARSPNYNTWREASVM